MRTYIRPELTRQKQTGADAPIDTAVGTTQDVQPEQALSISRPEVVGGDQT